MLKNLKKFITAIIFIVKPKKGGNPPKDKRFNENNILFMLFIDKIFVVQKFLFLKLLINNKIKEIIKI